MRQKLLLQCLFGPDNELREMALLSVAANERDAVRELVKVRRDAEVLLAVLISDLGFASGELQKNYSNQFWRRTSIRTLAAAVDGIIFCLKRLAFADAGIFKLTLNDMETFLLMEQQPVTAGKKPRFLRFQDNLKETFRVFAKVHKTTCVADFNEKGFDDLSKTYELRNRVMHPKSSATFSIRDDETKRAGTGLGWFHSEIDRLLNDSRKSIGLPPQVKA